MSQSLKRSFGESLKNDVHYWVCGAIVLSIFLIYFKTMGYSYVAFDDDKYVFENERVQQGLSMANVAWAFTSTSVSNWHPLTWISYMVDYSLFELRPGFYHLENMLIHMANALLVYLFLWRLTGASWKSGAVALLFAVHPMHVESVAWISERKDVLSVFWGLISLVAYSEYARRGAKSFYGLAWCAMLLSLLAKPMLVTLPCIFILLDYAPFGRFRDGGVGVLRVGMLEKIPFFILTVAVSIVAYRAQDASGVVSSFEVLPAGVRVINAVDAVTRYLLLTFIPWNLAVFYPYVAGSITPLRVLVDFAVVTGISVLVLRHFRTRPLVLVGWLWFLGALVPTLGFIQVGAASMADRYAYFPHIGFFMGLVWLLGGEARWGERRALIVTGLLSVFLSVVCAVAMKQVTHWRDSVTLFERAVRVTAPNSLMFRNLGAAYGMQGRHEDALNAFKVALELSPYEPQTYRNIGSAYLELGEPLEAELAFREAMRLEPYEPEFHVYLAIALYRQRKYEDAILRADEALRIELDYGPALDIIEKCRQAMIPMTTLDRE